MTAVANIIFKGLLSAFLIFAAAEVLRRGSAANFLPMAALALLLFAASVVSICYPETSRERVYPLLSVLLTLAVLCGTVAFTWDSGRNLGKINLVIVLGAVTVVAGALKEVFGQK